MSDSPSSLFEAALARLRRRGAAVGSGVILTLPAVQTACIEPTPTTSETDAYDWAQYEGVRNTRMVKFTGDWSHNCQSNTRFGCGTIGFQLTIRIKPRADADLAWKRVGIVYRSPDDPTERTAIGSYFTTSPDGDEEWHVSFNVPGERPVIAFDAWYQDGRGHTFVDDNEGELHVVNAGPAYGIVRAEPWLNAVVVSDAGVAGKLTAQIADLDYDKDVELVATKDGWATTIVLGPGSVGEKNKWYWAEDFPFAPGRERWAIDLDLPGGTNRFEYAVVYKHGIVNGAKVYEFWDNNGGGNYHVDKAP